MPRPTRSASDGAAASHAATIRALDELDAVAHAAVVQVYWHGRTQDQVAAELDLTVSDVRSAVARGLRQLGARILVP